jgi:hypothetical protein
MHITANDTKKGAHILLDMDWVAAILMDKRPVLCVHDLTKVLAASSEVKGNKACDVDGIGDE